MDFLKQAQEAAGKYTGGQQGQQTSGSQQSTSTSHQNQGQQSSSSGSSGGFLGGITDKFNSAAGGGRESEKNEDFLDKYDTPPFGPPCSHDSVLTRYCRGVDFVQEKFLGQGPQDNESAIEQAKDEQISDFIRGQYKSTTGKDIPIKDKETRFG